MFQNHQKPPTFVFSRPVDIPLNSTLEEPQETPDVVDTAFLPLAALVKPQVTRKPGDIAKALLKGIFPKKSVEDGGDASPKRNVGMEDDTTIATENSPDSKRSVSSTTPQKMIWLQSAGL